jgi:steroid delta-isomerase
LISLLLAMSIVFTAVGAATPARADVDSDTAAITNRLLRWTEAFNARDAAAVCDVFAPT